MRAGGRWVTENREGGQGLEGGRGLRLAQLLLVLRTSANPLQDHLTSRLQYFPPGKDVFFTFPSKLKHIGAVLRTTRINEQIIMAERA